MGITSSKQTKKKIKSVKNVIPSKIRPKLKLSSFGQLTEAIFIKILLLIDANSWNAVRRLNGHFYHLMDPTKKPIHKLWQHEVRQQFPLTAKSLKCKRWDLYLSYKRNKIKNSWQYNSDRAWMEDATHSEWMVIEGCNYDINRINKVVVNTNEYKENELYAGEIDKDKNMPKGFEDIKLYCPVVAYENFKYLDYITHKQYECIVCQNIVHAVTTLEEAKEKIAQNKCIRVVFTNGRSVFHLGGESFQDPVKLSQRARIKLEYEWLND